MFRKKVPWKKSALSVIGATLLFVISEGVPSFFDLAVDVAGLELSSEGPHQMVRVDRYGTVLERLTIYDSAYLCTRFANDHNDYFWNRFEVVAKEQKRALRTEVEYLAEHSEVANAGAATSKYQGLEEAKAEIEQIDLDLREPRSWQPAKCQRVNDRHSQHL